MKNRQMTDWQKQFATDFWCEQLSKNPKINETDLIRFADAFSKILRRKDPAAVSTVIKPQMTLILAMKEAEIPIDSFPFSQIDMVFISDGSIRIHENDTWIEKREKGP